jgi:WD40 repeat protein
MNGFLYSGGNDRNIRQWNISTGSQTNQFARHTATVNSIQLNEEMLFSGASDSRVVIWNRKTGDIRNTISMPTFVNALLVVQEYVVICTSSGIHSTDYVAGTFYASIEEGIGCNCLASTGLRVFSGHSDFLIKSRDFYSLEVLETYVGHQDNIHSVQLDATGILYSSALDGTIKRWNMLTRRVAYSFEDRNGSITAMNAIENILFIGTAGGEVQSFYLNNATRFESLQQHQNSITTMLTFEDDILTSSSDGTVKRFAKDRMNEATVLFNTSSKSIIGLTYLSRSFFVIIDAVQIVKFDPSLNNNDVRTIKVAEPLTCVTAAENLVVGGSRFGVIFGWSLEALHFMFDLNTHTSQVNSLLIDGPTLFSASEDKTILKWSLQDMVLERVLKRYSSSSLGHLGPVKSLSMCRGVLFSAGSDLTVRRWNTQTGNHEDVYFGHTKSVNVVLCHNVTVFSGGEDFAVYSYLPELPEEISTKSALTTTASKPSRAKRVTVVKWPLKNSPDSFFNSSVFLGLAIAAALVLTLVSVFGLHKIFSQRENSAKPTTDTGTYSSTRITDLKTIVNSVIGISKHAAYLLQQSAIAQERKIASGGGGELYIARVMDPVLRKKTGDTVIQKIVFVKSKLHEEAFYQEVGIMIMLSSFPHFCEIIGYTDSPLSLILKYYPDGSLFDWLRKNTPAHDYMVKILIEIAKAVKVMHSHYLAHCDLKTQNVLIKVQGKVPVCYLTDFGITQVLSEEIVASRMFNIVNLRGLSVYYAAPEAFNNFRSRVVSSANFKKYDIYSFACIVYEVIECKLPWK